MARKQMTEVEKKEWISKCWVTWGDVGFGCRQYLCFHPSYTAPIGTVFTTAMSDAAFVWHSFVLPWARRRGVRTHIHEQMAKHFKVISTGVGSKDGGRQFLIATGFKRDHVRKDWYWVRTS